MTRKTEWHPHEKVPGMWLLGFRQRCINDGGDPIKFARRLDVERAIESLLEAKITSPTKLFHYQQRHGSKAVKTLLYRYLQW